MWQITLDELGTGFSFTISSVLANRLLITVREKYYTYQGEMEDWETFTSMHFQTAPGAPGEETIALGTMDAGTMTTRSRWDEITTRRAAAMADEYEPHQFSETRGF